MSQAPVPASRFPHTEHVVAVDDELDAAAAQADAAAVTTIDTDGPIVTRLELWSYYLYVSSPSPPPQIPLKDQTV